MFDGRLMICATTFPGRDSAAPVVRELIESGLAVCAQIGADLESWYRWQGSVCNEPEVAVQFKIRDDRLDECMARLRILHPYETPQLLAWPATRVDEYYGRWAFGA